MRLFRLAIALFAPLLLSTVHAGDIATARHGRARVAIANEIPYGYMGLDGQAHGLGPDIARRVLTDMGFKDIRWVVVPFGSLIPALKAGRVDLVAASQAILPARCQQVRFSQPNSSYGEGLLVRKGNPDNIHSYADFVKRPEIRMGIVSGADQIDFAHAIGVKDAQIVTLASNTDAVSALTARRIDAYAATRLSAARLAQKVPMVEVASPFADPVVDGKPVRSYGAFSFRTDDQAFADAFDAALSKVKKTPFYRETLKHYGLPDHAVDAALKMDTATLCDDK